MNRTLIATFGLLSALLLELCFPVSARAGEECKDARFCRFVSNIIRERPKPEAVVPLVRAIFKDENDFTARRDSWGVYLTSPRGLQFSTNIRVDQIEFQYQGGKLSAVWMGIQKATCLDFFRIQQMFGAFRYLAPPVDSFADDHQWPMSWGRYVVGTNPGNLCVNFFTIEFTPRQPVVTP